jgi:hypothetical protein
MCPPFQVSQGALAVQHCYQGPANQGRCPASQAVAPQQCARSSECFVQIDMAPPTFSIVSTLGCSCGSSSNPSTSGAVYLIVPTTPGVKVRTAGALGVPGALLKPSAPAPLPRCSSMRPGEVDLLLGGRVGSTCFAMPRSPIFICT